MWMAINKKGGSYVSEGNNSGKSAYLHRRKSCSAGNDSCRCIIADTFISAFPAFKNEEGNT